MVAILKEWRLIGAVLLVIAAAWASWVVKDKFARAAEADRLESINTILTKQAEFNRHKLERAEQVRIDLSKSLETARASVRTETRTVIKKIPVHIKDDRACDIPVEVLKALNVARGHEP